MNIFRLTATARAADFEGWYVKENGVGLSIGPAPAGDQEPRAWAVSFVFGQDGFEGGGFLGNGALTLKEEADPQAQRSGARIIRPPKRPG